MRIEEAIKFAEHAQTMTDIPEVKEFYAMAEKALRTQNQVNWVSVKDRLPEKHKLVLARAVSTARGGNITFVGAFDGFYRLQQIRLGLLFSMMSPTGCHCLSRLKEE